MVTDKSSVYLNAVKVESVKTGLQFLGVGVASTTWIQADAALLNFSSCLAWSSRTNAVAEAVWSQSPSLTTDSPEAVLPELLLPSQDLVGVELAGAPVLGDPDEAVRLLSRI